MALRFFDSVSGSYWSLECTVDCRDPYCMMNHIPCTQRYCDACLRVLDLFTCVQDSLQEMQKLTSVVNEKLDELVMQCPAVKVVLSSNSIEQQVVAGQLRFTPHYSA